MSKEQDYKNEIANTRIGCLGSSDGKMLAQIASLGSIPQSALERLAVCKGLIPQTEIPYNAAVRAGDTLEMLVYENLKAKDKRYESNPLWVSKVYSRRNVKLISHPDIVLKDDENQTLYVYEVKTTKFNIEQTKHTYRAQLFLHSMLAKEVAKELGAKWKIKLRLVHYDTNGLNLEEEGVDVTFDPNRLTIKDIKFNSLFFDVNKAMDIVDAFLEDFNEYYKGDEVDANLLPSNIKQEFDNVTTFLSEIKEREQKVGEFKKRLCAFMQEKGLKSISNEQWGITLVNASESRSFDGKRFLEDYKAKYPRKGKALEKTYTKVSKKSAYVTIKIK